MILFLTDTLFEVLYRIKFYFSTMVTSFMDIIHSINLDILISTKTLFHKRTSYNVPVRNKIVSQSKIRKTVMKQKFKR